MTNSSTDKDREVIGKDKYKDIKNNITCPCGNDTFRMAEHISGPFRSLYVECTKCGNAISHGVGLYVRDVIFMMKGMWQEEYKESKESK